MGTNGRWHSCEGHSGVWTFEWARRFRTCDLSRVKNEEDEDPEAEDQS
jgi:hypothetical protein